MPSNKRPSTPSGPKTPEKKGQPSPPKGPQKTTPKSGENVVLPVRSSPSGRPGTPPVKKTPSPQRTSSSDLTPKPVTSTPKGTSPANHTTSHSTPKNSQVPGHTTRSTPGSAEETPKPRSSHPSASSSPSQHPPSQPTQKSPSKSLLPAAELHQSTPKPKQSILLEAFYEPLPSIIKAADFDASNDGNSSARTSQTIPPDFWVPIDISHYLAIADTELSRDSVKKALSAYHAPALEPTFRVRREADIVTYSATHLTHAVGHALNAILPKPVETVNEYSFSVWARVDRVWRERGAKTGSFAMLEMKNYGLLNPDEFEMAQYRGPEARRPSSFTDLDILPIIRQITNYAQIEFFKTRYACLYDGNFLFLGVFESPAQQTALPILRGTLIPCLGGQNNTARRALLGWLIEAWNKKQAGQNDHINETKRPSRPKRK